MDVRELRDEAERRAAVPVVRQLWPDADPAEVVAWTGRPGYHLLGGFDDGELVGVAGVRIERVLHHVRHAWLYDLVVDEPHRGEGIGSELVAFVERWAAERDCDYVALASPRAKEDIHRFYDRHDYEKWGYVIEKEL